MLFLSLIALWLLPIVMYQGARWLAPHRVWRSTGFVFGLVVSPASFGLYALYWWAGYLAVLGWPLGMILGWPLAMVGIAGLMLALLHGWPGFYLGALFGVIQRGVVVEGVQQVYLAILDGAVWAIVYGAVGWIADLRSAVGVRTNAA